MPIAFTLNGKAVIYEGDPDTPLLWAIRDEYGLTGTKYGCGMALCGACTVHIGGTPAPSCVTPVSALKGKRVVTIEGLAKSPQARVAKAVQDAWIATNVPQCGYCQSGQVMSAVGLLALKPRPTDADIDGAMDRNVCRCATYVRIRKAIHLAARSVKKA